ncbi:MAG TPA: hypothetical protein VHD56_12370 [Tepidisphaeraceae bacterium]|nr:hypothetical protein [Tepidisphaeraceae bacterium]
MEPALTILIFMGVITITAVIFVIWVIASILGTIFRGACSLFAPLPPMPAATRGRVCSNSRCQAVNPGVANYCRRCGSELAPSQRVHVRRVAMW